MNVEPATIGNFALMGMVGMCVSAVTRLALFKCYQRPLLDLPAGGKLTSEHQRQWNAFFAFQIIALIVC